MVLITSPVGASTAEGIEQNQWPLRMVRAQEAWAVSTGSGVVVAVIDTGIDAGHPELRRNALRGIDLIAGDRRPEDRDGHGTHVAGVIAAERDGKGVVGVAPDVTVLPIRVCDSTCPEGAIAEGIRWAVDHDADVINLSLSTSLMSEVDGEGDLVRDALHHADQHEVIVVAAAGNSSLPVCREPAAASTLCVGAVGPDGAKAEYSNFDASMVGRYLVAPGGETLPRCEGLVLSTFPRALDSACADEGYEALGGTSMAAPHVSGAAAVLLSTGISPAQTVHRLIARARDIGPQGPDPIYGAGLLDIAAALKR